MRTQHNLKHLNVHIPLGILACITGVSGSGKSTLVHDVLYSAIKRAKGEIKEPPGGFDAIRGCRAYFRRDPRGPIPDRQDAAVESGNIHEGL